MNGPEPSGGAGATRVAIIMDGNGRWATERGLPVLEGHRRGAKTMKQTVKDAAALGITELTVYAFSTENWSRPEDEVAGLMEMFAELIVSETPELDDEGVRMRFVGSRAGVSERLIDQMEWAENETATNTVMTLFVAFNYGGRAEILDAAERYEGGGEEAFAAAPLRARHGRSRARDPDERRAAALQLPALAERLLGVSLQRMPVARLRPGRARGGFGRVLVAATPVRGAGMTRVDALHSDPLRYIALVRSTRKERHVLTQIQRRHTTMGRAHHHHQAAGLARGRGGPRARGATSAQPSSRFSPSSRCTATR